MRQWCVKETVCINCCRNDINVQGSVVPGQVDVNT